VTRASPRQRVVLAGPPDPRDLYGDFGTRTSVEIRFADTDAMGHVNNAVYSTYLEQARIAILGGLEPFILARVEIDFEAPLQEGEEIEVRSRCPHVGTKSFTLEHAIWAGERRVAVAQSVLVGYDYDVGASVPLTENQRRRLAG
jgi:acyl-CoA thioester hydrolase